MSNRHDWIKSLLGHGETMCRKCRITNREAAVLGLLDICDAPSPPDDRAALAQSVEKK